MAIKKRPQTPLSSCTWIVQDPLHREANARTDCYPCQMFPVENAENPLFLLRMWTSKSECAALKLVEHTIYFFWLPGWEGSDSVFRHEQIPHRRLWSTFTVSNGKAIFCSQLVVVQYLSFSGRSGSIFSQMLSLRLATHIIFNKLQSSGIKVTSTWSDSG